MIKLAPSILSADFTRLGEEIRSADEAGADFIHVDVMDGHFVPNITIGPLVAKAARKASRKPMDVHLMIENPDHYVEEFAEAGADYLTVHVEAAVHLHRSVEFIRAQGVKPGVSLNPGTSLTWLEEIIPYVDLVLLMSVNPGFGGQKFIKTSLEKLQRLSAMVKEKNPDCLISIDGGVSPDNVAEVYAAGADIAVMGSAFYGSDDYRGVVEKVRRATESRS